MVLLRERAKRSRRAGSMTLRRPPPRHGRRGGREGPRSGADASAALRRVDHVSFEVHRGEIFGLLGPNGAGKTTTFRMLCGLLAASGGTLQVAGVDLRHARASARQRIGYVAQKFSLYGQLSVDRKPGFLRQRLRPSRRPEARAHRLGLAAVRARAARPAAQRPIPGGYKQRLAMAAALLHEPEILFLDEPTSGVDPLARREFWQRITALAEQGVTVIVTTHFMEEAEYCDRIAIMDAGRVLAQGTPAEVRRRAHPRSGPRRRRWKTRSSPSSRSRATTKNGRNGAAHAAERRACEHATTAWPAKLRRIRRWSARKARQVIRDPSSIAIGIVLPRHADPAVRLRIVAGRPGRAGRHRAGRPLAARPWSWRPGSSCRLISACGSLRRWRRPES